jgi:hypothetical protein
MKRQIITKQAERAAHKAKLAQFDAFIRDKGFARHMSADRIPKNPAVVRSVYEQAGIKDEGSFVTFPDYPDLRFAVKSAAVWLDNRMAPMPNMPKIVLPVKETKAAILLEMFGMPGCHFWVELSVYMRMFGIEPEPVQTPVRRLSWPEAHDRIQNARARRPNDGGDF